MTNLKKIESQKYFRVIWCLLGIWILWQFGSTMARSAFLPGDVRQGLALCKEPTEKNEQSPSSEPQRAQPPKNIFAPPPKHSIPKCMAVLGDEALINEKWYKVGGTVGDAKIVAINPESVKILWKEKEHTLMPFDVQVQYADQASGSQPASAKKEPSASPEPGGRSMGNVENGGPRGPAGMSDERRQMRERYQNASPEEQEAMRQQMRERSGRRGRGQRGGRPSRSRN